ncbi:MAG: hypothetical protein QHC65_11865 [Sphingomonas sp.]|nr:hypothetical protein [Sphingomonas sp.]MDX3885111.1 hypothetical protein [Sphingomonas sp.]
MSLRIGATENPMNGVVVRFVSPAVFFVQSHRERSGPYQAPETRLPIM